MFCRVHSMAQAGLARVQEDVRDCHCLHDWIQKPRAVHKTTYFLGQVGRRVWSLHSPKGKVYFPWMPLEKSTGNKNGWGLNGLFFPSLDGAAMRAGVQTGDRIIKVGILGVVKGINHCWRGTGMLQWSPSVHQCLSQKPTSQEHLRLCVFSYI